METVLNRPLVHLIMGLPAFFIAFMATAVNVALPMIGTDLAMNALMLSWVPSAYLLGTAMFLLPIGRVSDIHGRKKTFTIGLGLFTFTTLLIVFAPNAAAFILLRLIQGVGAALIVGPAMAIITSIFPPEERGRALGINLSAVYLGVMLGPFLGGVITQHLGWRSLFLCAVPVGVFVVCMVLTRLEGEWADARGERFDHVGSTLYALILVAFMWGLSLVPSWWGVLLVGASFAGMVAFVKWEQKVEHPIFDIRLFRKNRVFVYSNLTAMIQYSATFALVFLLSLYLQYIKGFSPQTAGLILMAQPIFMVLLTPPAGRLSDRIEPRLLVSAGMGLTSLGLFVLIFLHEDTKVFTIVAALVMIGTGIALFSSPNSNAIMSSVAKKHYGVAAGILSTMRLTGQMISMAAIMLLFSLNMGSEKIVPHTYPAFMKSVHSALIVFCLLCISGIFMSLARGNMHTERTQALRDVQGDREA